MKEKCLNRKKSLKHDNLLDADGLDLFLELNILKGIIGLENDKPIDILNYIKGINSFPNAYIAYRIMLIIPVSVASAERIFLKLKINLIHQTTSICLILQNFMFEMSSLWCESGPA